jgi:hypothetical protein
VYSLGAALGWCFTPGFVSSVAWFRVANQAEKPSPFWACLVASVGRFCLTACPERSRRDASSHLHLR